MGTWALGLKLATVDDLSPCEVCGDQDVTARLWCHVQKFCVELPTCANIRTYWRQTLIKNVSELVRAVACFFKSAEKNVGRLYCACVMRYTL